MPDMRRFEGRIALVTGGSAGLGRATAVRLAAEGADVAVVDIDRAGGEETQRLIEAEDQRCLFVAADVTQASDLQGAVEAVVETFGRLDVLFPAAGIGAGGSVVEISEELWDRVVDLDLKGVFLACKYAIPAMKKSGGAIVTVASIGGMQGKSGAAFCAAKAGVVNLTRSMAVAHAREGIRANCICPGWIPTAINQRALNDAKRLAQVADMHPMGRLGTPEDVAAAVAFWLPMRPIGLQVRFCR